MAKVINRYSKKIGCLPQILLGPVLNENSLIKTQHSHPIHQKRQNKI